MQLCRCFGSKPKELERSVDDRVRTGRRLVVRDIIMLRKKARMPRKRLVDVVVV
jgi:hypothetical protein